MYAVTTRSSSAYKLARVSNDGKVRARKFTAPESTPSLFNQQSSVAGASAVQATITDNQTNQQKFSGPQQQKINRFNLEMVNETPKNANSRAYVELAKQNGNVSFANKFMEIPYMIAMVNQNLSSMKPAKNDESTANAEPEAEENTEGIRQQTSKII
ncbi:MAG: hypothetical protein COB24_04955 [Hyphomicrobiales bacterium]|nr:MAG: hypothetical protein COB24_04955 [Hyphomicrobiales bacterium]